MKIVYVFLFLVVSSFSNETTTKEEYSPNVDCLILEDENSIICKFEVKADLENNQNITIKWIDPNKEVSRTRQMVIPVGDTSAYDFRYLDGRATGKWDFVVIYKDKEYTTTFELK